MGYNSSKSEEENKTWFEKATEERMKSTPNLQHIKHRQIGYAPNPMFEPNATTNYDPICTKELRNYYANNNSSGVPIMFGTGGEGFNRYLGFNDFWEQQPNPLEAFKAEYPMTPEEAWPNMIGSYQRKMLLLL